MVEQLRSCLNRKSSEIDRIVSSTNVIFEQFHERQLLATGSNEIVNPIDFYFPFDRCLLPMTAAKIDKFYNHWVEDDDSEPQFINFKILRFV